MTNSYKMFVFYVSIAANIFIHYYLFHPVLLSRGLLALSAGLFDEAHRHFIASTKLDPNNSVVSAWPAL